MIYKDRLEKIRNEAIGSIETKLNGAKKGHGWCVINETLCSFDVVEMTSELLNFRKKYGEYEGIKDND